MSIERKAETDRERFEYHYRKVRGDVPSYVFDKGLSNGRYFVLAVQLDWELWQEAIKASGRDELLEACIAAIVNDEIQEAFGSFNRNMDDELREKLRSAINKAGGNETQTR